MYWCTQLTHFQYPSRQSCQSQCLLRNVPSLHGLPWHSHTLSLCCCFHGFTTAARVTTIFTHSHTQDFLSCALGDPHKICDAEHMIRLGQPTPLVSATFSIQEANTARTRAGHSRLIPDFSTETFILDVDLYVFSAETAQNSSLRSSTEDRVCLALRSKSPLYFYFRHTLTVPIASLSAQKTLRAHIASHRASCTFFPLHPINIALAPPVSACVSTHDHHHCSHKPTPHLDRFRFTQQPLPLS